MPPNSSSMIFSKLGLIEAPKLTILRRRFASRYGDRGGVEYIAGNVQMSSIMKYALI